MASFGVRMILLREQLEREEIRIRRRESQFNLRADAFRLNDTRFKQLYRLPKPLVIYVCNALRDTLEPKCFKKNALSAEIKKNECIKLLRIYENSKNIKSLIKTRQKTVVTQYLLYRDSGYPMEPWLLTPILDAQQQNEQKYNSSLISTRIIVERCNGLLKSRFRCLHKHRVLNYSPYKAGLIINACAVLHNMCIEHKISLDENIELYDGMMGEMEHTVSRLGDDVSLGNKGREIQKRLLRSHFM